MGTGDRIEAAGREAARTPAVQVLARAGYAAKGFVYVLIGALAAQVAMGSGGKTTGTQGAVQQAAELPFGTAVLAALAVGLVGYALWRVLEAAIDPEDRMHGAKGVVKRIGIAISGIVYGGLAWSAVRLLTGSGGGGGGDARAQSLTAEALSKPAGAILVGLVGAGFIAAGAVFLHKAWTRSFERRLDPARMKPQTRSSVVKLARAGIAARAVVFVLLGVFLLRAAVESDPGEARGLGEALATLAAQPYGTFLLGVVALGLAAYGVYQFALARCRTFRSA